MITLTTAGYWFSSPIFGDMFLLMMILQPLKLKPVFVSYIRRYVLTMKGVALVLGYREFSSPIFGDMFLLMMQ